MNETVLYAFGSSFTFAISSVAFARLTREVSSAWMNTVKALVCWLLLAVVLCLTVPSPVTTSSRVGLFLSGAVGLGLGDLFLLGAFARMGAARTLLVFGFQPLFMGIAGHFLFGQSFELSQAAAIGFFLACLFVLSLERYRTEGHWEIRGLTLALGGILLDALGVLLSRWAFDASPGLDAFQANFDRVTGALVFYGFLSLVRPVRLVRGFRSLGKTDRGLAIGSSITGTFITLSLYLRAVRIGHLATISALALTGPLYSAALECVLQRKAPSRHLIGAFLCLVCGMGLALHFF